MVEYADRDANHALKARLAEVQGSYERLREGLAELQQRMASLQVTADSAENLVRATVDARGQLQKLALSPRSMRELSHEQLEALIVSTVRKATAQAIEEVAELLDRYSPSGSSAAAFVRSGNYDDLLRRTDEAAGYRPDDRRSIS
jgi:DNA-binding protein YbaB